NKYLIMGFFIHLTDLNNIGLFFLRFALAICFLYHGIDKLEMWKMEASEEMPVSMLNTLRFLSIVEPLGGIAILIGFLTQIAAIGYAIIMIGAIDLKVRKMQAKYGDWEMDLILLAASIALIFTGPGVLSIDHLLFGF